MNRSITKLCCIILLVVATTSVLTSIPTKAEGTPAATQDVPGQKVKIKASDGLDLVGLFYPVVGGKAPAVLLLHDGVSTKEQWLPYVPSFTRAGYNVLVVDQRGMGETGLGTPAKSGGPELHDQDVLAMAAWLRQQSTVDGNPVALIGTRLGANYAIRACAIDDQCHTVIALTPSTDFFGVKTVESIKAMTKDKSLFMIAGQIGESGAISMKQLYAAASNNINIMTRIYGLDFKFGTDLFDEDPNLMPMVLLWLNTYNHSS